MNAAVLAAGGSKRGRAQFGRFRDPGSNPWDWPLGDYLRRSVIQLERRAQGQRSRDGRVQDQLAVAHGQNEKEVEDGVPAWPLRVTIGADAEVAILRGPDWWGRERVLRLGCGLSHEVTIAANWATAYLFFLNQLCTYNCMLRHIGDDSGQSRQSRHVTERYERRPPLPTVGRSIALHEGHAHEFWGLAIIILCW